MGKSLSLAWLSFAFLRAAVYLNRLFFSTLWPQRGHSVGAGVMNGISISGIPMFFVTGKTWDRNVQDPPFDCGLKVAEWLATRLLSWHGFGVDRNSSKWLRTLQKRVSHSWPSTYTGQ
jgi:hypothetical protein